MAYPVGFPHSGAAFNGNIEVVTEGLLPKERWKSVLTWSGLWLYAGYNEDSRKGRFSHCFGSGVLRPLVRLFPSTSSAPIMGAIIRNLSAIWGR